MPLRRTWPSKPGCRGAMSSAGSRPRSSSRKSSRPWTGRCSNRRNGSSTRRRSSRTNASRAASPSGRANEEALERAEERSAYPPRSSSPSSASRPTTVAIPAPIVSSTALATLAFDYPRRAPFFRGELKEFLLLAREQGFSPLVPKGSFAGAMGLPQFMPGSYRRFAIDFDGDGRVDLWRSNADVIGSVANYLARHDWQPGPAGAARRPTWRPECATRRCGASTAASASVERSQRGRPTGGRSARRRPDVRLRAGGRC